MSELATPHAARPRCSVYIAASLDGFIARPGGGLDWLSIVARDGEDYGYKAFFETIDVLVMGRKTYETALGFSSWPYEGKRCVVVTRTPPKAQHGETFHSGALDVLVERLGREGVRRAYVDGGALIRGFLDADLVDDVTLSIIPVLLGDGVRLFGGKEHRLALVSSRSFESGLVQLHYRVAKAGGDAKP